MRESAKHVIDAYMGQVQELTRRYVERGMSADEAEDRAVDDVRREIRTGPPIRLTD